MVNNSKTIILITIFGLLISCSTASKHHESKMEQTVGWLHGNCLAIKNSHIEFPLILSIINFGAEQKHQTGTIVGQAKSQDGCYALFEDRKNVNISSGYSFYIVESNIPINFAIGFLKLNNHNNFIFDYCTTSEGILFSIFKNKIKVWEGYYYLGHGSESTCEYQNE
jgi:hypothetical protein